MTGRPAHDVEERFALTRDELCAVLGVVSSTIGSYVQRGMPRLRRGVYDVRACVQWALEQVRLQGAIDIESIPDVVAARTALYIAQEKHKRLETRIRAGDVVELDQVHRVVMDLGALLLAGLESLPARLGPEICGQEPAIAEESIRHAVDAVRAELGESVRRYVADSAAARRDVESAAPSNGGAVGGSAPKASRRQSRTRSVAH